MTKAIALVVGLVRVDRNAPDYIKFPSGRTAGIGGCKDDADRMETLLNKKGFDINKLVTEQATGGRILMISDTCHSGTIFRGQARRAENFSLEAPLQIKASLIHLAATHDSTTALGDHGGSIFTNALLEVWDDGKFPGDYSEFISKINAITKSNSYLSMEGPNVATFAGQKPFTV